MSGTTTTIVHAPIDMRPPVKVSSMVKATGYNSANLILRVEFGNGGTYDYLGVSQDVADGLHGAESPGRYMQQHIKGQYDSKRWAPTPYPSPEIQNAPAG